MVLLLFYFLPIIVSIFFQIKDMVVNPISDFDRVTNKLWQTNMHRDLGKSKQQVQQDARELWSTKYKGGRDKTGFNCFLAAKIEPQTVCHFFTMETKGTVTQSEHHNAHIDNNHESNISATKSSSDNMPVMLSPSETAVVTQMLESFEVDSSKLLSINVTEVKAFMLGLAIFCSSVRLY